MAKHYHAIVRIDHQKARILGFNDTAVDVLEVEARAGGHHLEHRANVSGSGHHGVDREYFGRVLDQLEGTGAILLTGPGQAKLEFRNFVAAERPAIAERIRAVESVDHPSDAALVAHGRTFFHADDRMHAQVPGR